MTKQQKEEFMRKNLGDQMSESSDTPEGEQEENGKNPNGKNGDNKTAGQKEATPKERPEKFNIQKQANL